MRPVVIEAPSAELDDIRTQRVEIGSNVHYGAFASRIDEDGNVVAIVADADIMERTDARA